MPHPTPPKPLSHHRIDWAAAAEMLAAGLSTQETAERLGIHRTTVWRALKISARFRAAVEERRARRVSDTAARLEALRGEVAEALVVLLRDGDRRVLLWLADRLGVMGLPSVPGGAGAAAHGLPALVSPAAAAAPGEGAARSRMARAHDTALARARAIAAAEAERAAAKTADETRTAAKARATARRDRLWTLGPETTAAIERMEADADRFDRAAEHLRVARYAVSKRDRALGTLAERKLAVEEAVAKAGAPTAKSA